LRDNEAGRARAPTIRSPSARDCATPSAVLVAQPGLRDRIRECIRLQVVRSPRSRDSGRAREGDVFARIVAVAMFGSSIWRAKKRPG